MLSVFVFRRDGSIVSIQEPDPAHCHIDGPEILLHPPFQDIGPGSVEHVAEPVVDLGEEQGLVKAGGVFKGDELHGVPVLCKHRLAAHQPAHRGDLFSHMGMEVPGFDIMASLQNIVVSIKRMHGKEKAQGLCLVLEHEVFGIKSP